MKLLKLSTWFNLDKRNSTLIKWDQCIHGFFFMIRLCFLFIFIYFLERCFTWVFIIKIKLKCLQFTMYIIYSKGNLFSIFFSGRGCNINFIQAVLTCIHHYRLEAVWLEWPGLQSPPPGRIHRGSGQTATTVL